MSLASSDQRMQRKQGGCWIGPALMPYNWADLQDSRPRGFLLSRGCACIQGGGAILAKRCVQRMRNLIQCSCSCIYILARANCVNRAHAMRPLSVIIVSFIISHPAFLGNRQANNCQILDRTSSLPYLQTILENFSFEILQNFGHLP